ncbi:MAG: hypothetical protein L6265_07980 [Thermoplasmatales archaeon]|nr:hypothetical protein [Thermoplasmatales archaeon]
MVPGWSKDIRLTNDTANSLHPSIAVDLNGTIYVVWEEARDIEQSGYWGIYFTKSNDGGETWSNPERINAPSNDGHAPNIIIDQNNTIHVVWSGAPIEENYYEIYYKKSTDGGNAWSEDIRLTYAPDDSFTPKIVAYGNTLHLVWSDKRDGNFEIYYKRSNDGGNSWSDDVRLTNDGGDSKLPSIGSDLVGNLHVVWYDKRADIYQLYYREGLNCGEQWEDEICLSQGHGFTTLIADSPACLTDSCNNVHIFWQDGPFGQDNIFYKKKSGDSWDQEKEIVSGDSRSTHPSSIIDSTNSLHLIWDDDREGRDLYYNMRAEDWGTWGEEIKITHSTNAWDPAITIDPTNIIHVVWVDKRDDNQEIYYKRTLNPVTEPPIVVTQTLNLSTCKPGNSVLVSGGAKWNNTPVINGNVTVKIIETDAKWATSTDSNGNYNLTITAPSTPGNYTIRVTVALGNLTGTKYAKLTVESEGVTNGGIQPEGDKGKEGFSIIYLAIAGAVAGGIIVALALLKWRKTEVAKIEKPKEEQKPDLKFPSKIQTMTLRCPGCRTTFSVELKPKPFNVKCLHCGKEGVLR